METFSQLLCRTEYCHICHVFLDPYAKWSPKSWWFCHPALVPRSYFEHHFSFLSFSSSLLNIMFIVAVLTNYCTAHLPRNKLLHSWLNRYAHIFYKWQRARSASMSNILLSRPPAIKNLLEKAASFDQRSVKILNNICR